MKGLEGQYDTTHGGAIFLVENESDVSRLAVKDPSHLAYVTQTTLSVDDTAKVIDALGNDFQISWALEKMIFVMRPKTGRMPSNRWPIRRT